MTAPEPIDTGVPRGGAGAVDISTDAATAGQALLDARARAARTAPVAVAALAAALHRPVHDEDGLADLLQRAASAAVQWLPDVDYAGVTVQFDGAPFTAADTDPAVLAVDAVQYELGDGPCLTAMRTVHIVTADAAQAAARWPQFASASAEHGVRSYLASPLAVDGVGRGSLNLYSRSAAGFTGPESDLVAVLSEYVSRGLADYATIHAARTGAVQMQNAMAGRAPIEQAKGILMAVHQISEDAAFELLREQSQNTNTKLRDVATTFVAAHSRQDVAATTTTATTTTAPDDRASGAGDFQSAFDHAPIGMAIADPFGVLLTVNPALGWLLGAAPQRLVGTTLFDVTHPEDVAMAHASCADLRTATQRRTVLRLRLRGAGGEWVPVTVSTASVQGADGSAAHLVMHVEDDTEHYRQVEVLRQQALHDPLTALPNRVLFLERLHHGSGRHERARQPLSVLFCDIDEFKVVNDTLGHHAGDAVLLAVAARLREQLRPGDTAARLGGDEFAVLCENTDALAAASVAGRLTAALGAPLDADGTPVTLTVSIGAATSTARAPLDPELLWRAADAAMYEAKRRRH